MKKYSLLTRAVRSLLLAAALVPLSSLAHAADSRLVDDAYTTAAKTNFNFGSAAVLNVSGKGPSAFKEISYLKFGFDALPAGTVGSQVS